MYNVSAFVFTKNTFHGGWPLFEAMANALCICDEVRVLDLGSTDNTWEVLWQMSLANPRIKTMKGSFDKIDAGVFADLPNEMQKHCTHDNLMYFQSDEIWHEELLALTEKEFKKGNFDLSFWRYHLRNNCQIIRQFPQRVHRVGKKGEFNFIDDGMNTDRANDAPLVGHFHGGYYMKWGAEGGTFKLDPPYLPTWEMIMDGGLIGMFRSNVYKRKAMHEPFWRDGMSMPAWNEQGQEIRISMEEWINKEIINPEWENKISPFNIPKIMRGLVGELKYKLRPEVEQALMEDRCRELIYG